VEKNFAQSQLKIDVMKTDVTRVTTLQVNNRKELATLEAKV